jgi:endonuclease III
MTRDEIIEIARSVNIHKFRAKNLEKFVEIIFEKGRQQGMKQERALWKLAETSQELGGYDHDDSKIQLL